MIMAAPLLLLMVVRGRRVGPAGKRCSVTGKALLFHRAPTCILENSLIDIHKTGESKYEQHGTMKRNQVWLILLGSNPSITTH